LLETKWRKRRGDTPSLTGRIQSTRPKKDYKKGGPTKRCCGEKKKNGPLPGRDDKKGQGLPNKRAMFGTIPWGKRSRVEQNILGRRTGKSKQQPIDLVRVFSTGKYCNAVP